MITKMNYMQKKYLYLGDKYSVVKKERLLINTVDPQRLWHTRENRLVLVIYWNIFHRNSCLFFIHGRAMAQAQVISLVMRPIYPLMWILKVYARHRHK